MQGRELFYNMVAESRAIVFFGGAGVSTECGIPDFRSPDGLYHQKYKYPPEEMLGHDFFVRHKREFFAFYREKMLITDVEPGTTHKKLAALEATGKLTAVVTQNIDGLHQKAGSRHVYELHGSIYRNHCMSCGKPYDAEFIRAADGVPRCTCGGVVKPDVVLYGEMLDDAVVQGAIASIAKADMLIVGGTSLAVYPAAGLIGYYQGDRLALVNKSETPYDSRADLVLHCALADVFGDLSV